MIWWLVALVVLVVALAYTLDRLARAQGWRLGPLSNRIGTRSILWVEGARLELDGHCEHCGTSWRYAIPHLTFIRKEDQRVPFIIVCAKCRRELPLDVVWRRYQEWWVRNHDRILELGLTPDPRELEDLKAALRVGG